MTEFKLGFCFTRMCMSCKLTPQERLSTDDKTSLACRNCNPRGVKIGENVTVIETMGLALARINEKVSKVNPALFHLIRSVHEKRTDTKQHTHARGRQTPPPPRGSLYSKRNPTQGIQW